MQESVSIITAAVTGTDFIKPSTLSGKHCPAVLTHLSHLHDRNSSRVTNKTQKLTSITPVIRHDNNNTHFRDAESQNKSLS